MNAGLPGTFIALLSTSVQSAVDRLGTANGWVRVDGRPVARTQAELRAGTLLFSPHLTEFGGFLSDGGDIIATGAGGDATCAEYTSPTDSVEIGPAGSVTEAAFSAGVRSCTTEMRLYCLQVDYNNPNVYVPLDGRIAFLSGASWDPSRGRADADRLCQTEAEGAGLAGSFLALLSGDGAPAIARLDLSGPRWVRSDGLVLADATLAYFQGRGELPLIIGADGSRALGSVRLCWTGGDPLQLPTSDCSDWTSSDAAGSAGLCDSAGRPGLNASAEGCSRSFQVYCFEQ